MHSKELSTPHTQIRSVLFQTAPVKNLGCAQQTLVFWERFAYRSCEVRALPQRHIVFLCREWWVTRLLAHAFVATTSVEMEHQIVMFMS